MQANIRVGCSIAGVSVSKRGHLSVKLARLYGDLLAKPATVFVSAVVPGLGPRDMGVLQGTGDSVWQSPSAFTL
ncbi:hypothetical protein HaLaN_17415, partial [Haematococcus lacustris]